MRTYHLYYEGRAGARYERSFSATCDRKAAHTARCILQVVIGFAAELWHEPSHGKWRQVGIS